MFYYEVAPTKIAMRCDTLTYSSDTKLSLGSIVLVSVRNTEYFAVVISSCKKPTYPVKPIAKVILSRPLPPHLLKSLIWLSSYYACPLPLALSSALPSLTKNIGEKYESQLVEFDSKEVTEARPSISASTLQRQASSTRLRGANSTASQLPPLTKSQQTALEQIKSNKNTTRLLHGITGSGKTHIYIHLIAEALASGRSALLLVPEISLTSQLVSVLSDYFPDLTLLHSRLTPATRRSLWLKTLYTDSPQIIVGTRSALFSPIANLGAIIIDESHDPSYLQDQSPKYSALRLASVLAANAKPPAFVLLGSATPNIVDYYIASQKKALVSLSEKAKKVEHPPEISIVSLKNRAAFTKNPYLSNATIEAIQEALSARHQVLIFHNRRGTASLTICEHCGWEALCPQCYLPLALHGDNYTLLCHSCSQKQPVPSSCPTCHNPSVLHKGIGTKLLESELNKLFVQAKIIRFDSDSASDQTFDKLYKQVRDHQYDIIIGTQHLAKGLDLPSLRLVVVPDADSGLALPDFAAEERVFNLISQVVGRVGRGHNSGTDADKIIIQTYRPEHPLLRAGVTADYQTFYNIALTTRRRSLTPPFMHLLRLSFTRQTERLVIQRLAELHKDLTKKFPDLTISPPRPAFHERSPKGYTWELLVKSPLRAPLLKVSDSLPTGVLATLDPPSLL